MASRVLVTACALALGAVAIGCGLDLTGEGATGFDAGSDGGGDATLDGAAAGETSPGDDGGGRDSAPDAAPPRDGGDGGDGGGAEAGCIALQPPAMVRVGAVCIDVTEVTNDQYRTFLAAANQPPPSSVCTWNTTFIPDAGSPPSDNFPVLVNWCNAQGYCTWAGKRLCGALGGGSLTDNTDVEDPAKGQWVAACTNGGTIAFPYGDTFSATACASGGIHPTGALTTCQGPATGLFDMSGNAWEWTDACNGSNGAGDDCAIMGGSYQSLVNQNELKCRAHSSGKRAEIPHLATGFRCCSP